MKRRVLSLVCGSILAFFGVACGGGGDNPPADAGPPDARGTIFPPVPECEGVDVLPLMGGQALVISHLEIGTAMDGFDLDHDGDKDNKLAGVGSLANGPIRESLDKFEIVIPFEFFDFPSVAVDACVKFGIYMAHYQRDIDLDGEKTSDERGDCNDHDMAIHPGVAEVVGNFIDDDCDGQADEIETIVATDGGSMVTQVPSPDVTDHDGDGQSMAAGDCDDRAGMGMSTRMGGTEVCGDGLDNDCDTVADMGTVMGRPACTPFDDTPDLVDLDPLSFNYAANPVTSMIEFNNGKTVMAGAVLQLQAGPSIFGVTLPISSDISLDLRISGAQIVADVIPLMGVAFKLDNGHLGGVLDAHTLDQIRGLDVEQIGLKPEDSLADAMFTNVLGIILGLKEQPPGCHQPDIDVDGDGLESFCDTNPNDTMKIIDKCMDGDGTVVMDSMMGTTVVHCTEARNADGSFKFADGVSVELNFEAVGVRLPTMLPPAPTP